MAEITQDTATVILKNDPSFPEYFDFEMLRREGLRHIGNLSGKIWTDHNLHDPGITILETLCYALIDLGYKTQLPIQDLLSQNPLEITDEDNFFTPAEILTNNPLTIIDYRKMLIEIDGVKNAWLTILENDPKIKIPCVGKGYFLNGIYKVTVELDSKRVETLRDTIGDVGENIIDKDLKIRNEIIKKAQEKLHAHRNLSEDFDCNITILNQVKIAICGEIILMDDAQIDYVHTQIIEKIQRFFSPDIRFYSLQDLLQKDKTIEEIFAGRPFYKQSRGFIDTEELENIHQHESIHLSDIYNLILDIEGVRAANDLVFCKCSGKIIEDNAWSIKFEKNEIPFLDVDCLKLLFKKNGAIQKQDNFIDNNVHFNKVSLASKYLDLSIPKGNYIADLAQNISIQNELPQIYGVGQNELPDSVTDERKSQVLQLQGYLLFYDQILAGYAMQLSHLRTVFSLRPDSKRKVEERHTYFKTDLASIPQIQKLLKLYQQSYSDFGWSTGSVVARLVDKKSVTDELASNKTESGLSKSFLKKIENPSIFDSEKFRDFVAQQLRRDTLQEEIVIQIKEDELGFFFMISFSAVDHILMATEYFLTLQKANEAASIVVILAGFEGNYQSRNHQNDNKYYFELVFRSHNYLENLEALTESEEVYLKRREQFLNHLLSRFQETFNDYALLSFTKNNAENLIAKRKFIKHQNEAKGAFLSRYANISRNRGRAFNYLKGGWGASNMSGFEKRIGSLAGWQKKESRELCHFEIVKCEDEFECVIQNYKGENVLKISQIFDSEQKAFVQLQLLVSALNNPEKYFKVDNSTKNYFQFCVRINEVEAYFPKSFSNAIERDKKLLELQRIFRTKATDEDIFVAKNAFYLSLSNINGNEVFRSIDYEQESGAKNKKNTFILNQKGFSLNQSPFIKDQFLNLKPFKKNIAKLPTTYKWHLEKDNDFIISEQAFETKTETLNNFTEILNQINSDFERKYITEQIGLVWQLKNGKNTLLEGTQLFGEERKVVNAFLNAKKSKNYKIIDTFEGMSKVLWMNEKDEIIGQSPEFKGESEKIFFLINDAFLKTKKAKIVNKDDTCFGFKVTDNQGVDLMISYQYYESKLIVLKQLFEVINLSQTPKNFYKSGDEANMNFSFQLRAENGQFVAEHPSLFDNEKERNYELTKVSRYFKGFKFPLNIVQQKDKFTFNWLDNDANKNRVLVKSLGVFETEIEADNCFKIMLYSFVESDDLLIKNIVTGETIAIIEDLQYKNIISESINQASYFLNLGIKPVLWKFRYWQNSETNFESTDAYSDVITAENYYAEFVENLPNFTVNATTNTLQFQQKDIANIKSSKIDLDDTVLYLRYKQVFQENLQNFIRKTALCESGNYIFHVLKKEPSLAFNPLEQSISDGGYFHENPCQQKFEFLEICFTNIVHKKIYLIDCQWVEKYHFVIKELYSKDNLFISYDYFSSPEEAILAFQVQYINILRIASKKGNYGILILQNFDSHAYESYLCGVEKPVAFVADNAKSVIDYAHLAAQFPIRIYNEKYSFRVVDNDKYKVLWRSTNTYSTPEEAIIAFKVFLEVLKYKHSCQFVFDEETCKYHAVVNEILLVSSKRYTSKEFAWAGLEEMLLKSCHENSFYHYQSSEGKYSESFWIVNENFGNDPNGKDKLYFSSETECINYLADVNYPAGYHCHKLSECGSYSIDFWDASKILAYHPQFYNDGIDVKLAIDRTKTITNDDGMHLLEHILLRNSNCLLTSQDGCECNNFVWKLDIDECDIPRNINVAPCADPYSFWVTLMLPNWTCKFKDPQFRILFENLLYREAPAHIALNIHWLSPKQMCTYEHHYKQWIQSMKYACTDQMNQNCLENTCDFIGYLNQMVFSDDSITGRILDNDCGCHEKEIDIKSKERAALFTKQQILYKNKVSEHPRNEANSEVLSTIEAHFLGGINLIFLPDMIALSKINFEESIPTNEYLFLGILNDFAFKNEVLQDDDLLKIKAVKGIFKMQFDSCQFIEKWKLQGIEKYTSSKIIQQIEQILLL